MAVIHRARVVDVRQQGFTVSEFDSLFQIVEQAEPYTAPAVDALPAELVTELQWPVLVEEVQK